MQNISIRTLPVVFLPGLLETHHIWRQVIDALHIDPEKAEALDLPGHSPGEDKAAVLRNLMNGDWLESLASRIRFRFDSQKAIIVGHSTGGMIALQFAYRYPELVDSLVLIGALSKGGRGHWFDPSARLVKMPFLGTAAFRAGLKIWLSSPKNFQRGYARGAMNHRVKMPAPEAMRRQLRACDPMALHATAMWVLQNDIHKDIPLITCPILAIIGNKDPVVSPVHQINIIRSAPQAFAKLVSAGHLPFAECPDQVIHALDGWRMRPWMRKVQGVEEIT